jgi:preprotein translocase subunit SecD
MPSLKIAAIALALIAACAVVAPVLRAQPAPGAAATTTARPTITFEVDTDDVRRTALVSLREQVTTTLREAHIQWARRPFVRDGSVGVALRAGADVDAAVAKLRALSPDVAVTMADGAITLTPSAADMQERERQAVEKSATVIERRLAAFGVKAPSVERGGSNRIVVSLPDGVDRAKVGEMLRPGAKLEFRLIDTSMTPAAALAGTVPPESEVLYERGSNGQVPYLVLKQTIIDGSSLSDAQGAIDARIGKPVILFRFDVAGARRFAEATRENVGRPFAIVIDNEVVSAPVIREPILGGSGQISGNFTLESANTLATLLRAGTLPAKLKVIDPAAPR